MFAPPVKAPKAQTASYPVPTRVPKLPQRSFLRHGLDTAEQTLTHHPSRGSRAVFGRSADRSPPGKFADHKPDEPDSALTNGPVATTNVSWDFSTISVFPPHRLGAPQSPYPPLQPKLAIGQVNDPLEREADRVADQVMRTPALAVSAAAASLQISRKCEACEEEDRQRLQAKLVLQAKPASRPVNNALEQDADAIGDRVMQIPKSQLRLASAGGKCPNCQMRQPAHSGAQPQTESVLSSRSRESGVPLIAREVLSSPGQPLEPAARAFFEPRFGYDFSRVRVHAGREASDGARAVGARAYTIGRHIAFGSGEYAPATVEGKRLLAHELAHVVQQARGQATLRTLQRQPAAGGGDRPNVNRVKWSVESEQLYRNAGEVGAANAIRACRVDGGRACEMILTEQDVINKMVASGGKETAAGGAAVAGAAPLLKPPSVPAAPESGVRVVTRAAGRITPVVEGGAESGAAIAAAELAAPAALAAYLAAAGYTLYQYVQFQHGLIKQGYIILRPHSAICMQGCHHSTPPAPVQLAPSPRLMPGDTPDAIREWVASERRSPRRGAQRAPEVNVDPWAEPGTKTEHRDPCDMYPMAKCADIRTWRPTPSGTTYQYDSFAAAIAAMRGNLPLGYRNAHLSSTRETSTEGPCSPMAGVSGAHVGQHETFYAGNTKVGTVVCCPCCERGEGQSATFLTLCAIHNQLLP